MIQAQRQKIITTGRNYMYYTSRPDTRIEILWSTRYKPATYHHH